MTDQPQPSDLSPDEELTPPSYYEGLTDRQRRFIEEYCIDFNATRAAKSAGYSEKTASEIGRQNLRKLEIRKAIDAYMDECTMSASEALARLTAWGRGTIEPFVEPYGRGLKLDLSTDVAKNNIHLIKEVGHTANGVYIKLHDAKDAVLKILEIRGKLVQKHEHSGPDGGPIKTDVNSRRTWLLIDHTGGKPVPAPDQDY